MSTSTAARCLALSLLTCTAQSLLSACDGETKRDPSQYPISRTELERNMPSEDPAELNYRRYCIGCHGSDGHGNGGTTGADLAGSDSPLSTRTDAELISSVRNGKTGKLAVMPAHSPVLDDTQIAALVDYVKKRFAPAAAPSDAVPAAGPSPQDQLVERADEAKPVPKPEGSPAQTPTPAAAP